MTFIVKALIFTAILQIVAYAVMKASLKPRFRSIVETSELVLVLLIPAVGLLGYNKNVFYGLLFLLPLTWSGSPLKLMKRYLLTLVSIPLLNEIYNIGGIYLGSLSSVLFLNAGTLLALTITRRATVRPVRSIDAAVWMVIIAAILIFTRGDELGGTIRSVASTLLLIVPPYYLLARVPGTAQDVEEAMTAIVFGGVCNAVVGVFTSVKRWALYETFYQALHVKISGISANASIRAGLLRAGGAVANYEVLGLVTATALLAALASRRRFTPLGFYAVVAVLGAGLFVSQARSAWLAMLVGLALYAAYRRYWRQLGMMAVLGLGGLLFLQALPAGNRLAELLGKSGHANETAEYRQGLLTRGLQEVRRHPLTGQTLNQLQVSMNDLRQGEHIIDFVNTHLYVALVGGLGGLLAWIAAWSTPMVWGWRQRANQARPDLQPLVVLPFAMTGMTFVFLTFTSPVDRIFSLAAIGMGLMSSAVRVRAPAGRVRKAAATAPVVGSDPAVLKMPAPRAVS